MDDEHWRQVALVGKPLLMPALAARAVSAPRGPGTRWLLVAHAFSWGGDLALMRESRAAFLTGLSSFAVAQLAYVSAYRTRSSAPVLGTPGRRRFLSAGVAFSTAMALAATRRSRSLAVPVAAYGTAITTMVAAAAAVDPQWRRGRLLTGAALFLASDTLIGVRMFLLGNRAPRAAVMATYTLGQWCISDAMAATGPTGRREAGTGPS
jgi:uncharacterized membrane protein YhhN